MKEKSVISTHFPYLPLTVSIRKRQETIEALLDTGFDGGVVIPPHLITNSAPPDSYVRWTLADGSPVLAPAYLGMVKIGDLGNAGTFATVISVLGDVPIIGRTLADRFKITLDHGRRVVLTV